MKKLAGALLAVLMVATGLLISTASASAQNVEESPDTEGEVGDLTDAQREFQNQVVDWARRGAEAGLQDVEDRLNRGIEDLRQDLADLEGRLTVGGDPTWLPEFCFRWMTELNKTNVITDTNTIENETTDTTETPTASGAVSKTESTTTSSDETVNTRSLAGQFLKSRVGAMLIFIVNGVELCALKVDLR